MRSHPGVSLNTPTKVQPKEKDSTEDHTLDSANSKPAQLDETQGVAESPEKGDSTDPLPVNAGSKGTDEIMDTTV